jgi:ribonucleoside-diphosphate reductase alpha chain
MKINEYIAPILKSRYLQPGETPEAMLRRVATFIASDEVDRDIWAARFYDMMDRGDFMPSSPILMNAGTEYPMMSACFVLDIPDDMAGIFQAVKDMALIQQHGGGTGFNFSKIREKGAIVRSTHGIASGVLSFLEVFNAATNIVKQGGKRRGANIALLSVDHPEIEDFIDAKLTDGKLSNFNISVALSDAFMNAVLRDGSWQLISRVNGEPVKEVMARDLLRKIIDNMWANGEPGIIFSDTIERHNPTPQFGPLTGVNPCGEVSLYDKEACNLGSINLENFTNIFRNRDELDRFKRTIETAVRFLDNTIFLNRYPVQGIYETVLRTRKIGLGVTGLHSWLLLNGFKYSSDEGQGAAHELVALITDTGRKYSKELADEKGSLGYSNYRNSVITCIAPTGTISMILDASSSGIEPVFSYTYERRIGDETHHIEAPILRKLLAKYNVEATPELIRQIENEGGVLSKIPSLPQELRELAETAQEISPIAHLEMLASVQTVVDNNISKTIAVPNDGRQNLHGLIHEAWCLGVRGFTVYRDGSRGSQVINAVELCPVCGQPVVKEEGCKHCTSCGWSTCAL